jgi:hypothetical protein
LLLSSPVDSERTISTFELSYSREQSITQKHPSTMAPATTYTFSTIRNNPNLLKRCDGSNTTVPLTNSFADPDAVRDLIARKMLDGTPFVLRQTGKRKVLKYHVFTGE